MLSKGICGVPHRQAILTKYTVLKLKMFVLQSHPNCGNIQITSKIYFAVRIYAMLAEHVFSRETFSSVFWITNYFNVSAGSGDIAPYFFPLSVSH